MTHIVYYIIMIYFLGKWIAPVITGTRPPPCTYFTINTLPGNTSVIFGGISINYGLNHFYCVNDLYFAFSQDKIVSCVS